MAPVVPFIPAIIGGVASVFGAHEAASATKDAAKTQADYANRALDIQQQQYQQRLQNLTPYRQAGTGALGQLNTLMGLPGPPKPGPGLPSATDAMGNPVAMQQAPGTARPINPLIGGVPTGLIAQNGPNDPGYYAPGYGPGAMNAAGAPNAAGSTGPVSIKAPNGNVYAVPQNMVAQALANGGQRV